MAVHVGVRGPGHLSRLGGFYPDASLALAFTDGRYRVGSGANSSSDFASLPGLTVTRASVGYAETSSGSLVQFASGVARITDKGLLVEEARTNTLLQSQTLQTTWAGSGGALPTVTADQGVAPDGTTTADQIAFGAAADSQIVQPQTLTAATYQVTVYAKTTSGTKTFRLKYWNGAVDAYSSDFTATTTWQRFTFQITGVASAGNVAVANGSAGTAGSILAWGAQVELGAFATSYIPTTSASATRAADVVSIGSLSIAAPYTIVADLAGVPDVSTTDILNTGSLANGAGLYLATGSPTAFVREASVSTALTSVGTATVNTPFKVAARFAVNDTNIAKGGASGTADTSNTPPTVSTLGISRSVFAFGGGYLNGYLKSAVIYPTAYTNAQLQAATL